MRPSIIWALAPFLSSTNAFKDTSPFFLFSTSELLTPSQPNLVSASTLSKAIIPKLETCPSDTYIIVSQPGVHAADFTDKRATPLLTQIMTGNDKQIRSSLAVTDVLGSLDADQLGHVVKEKCGAGFLRVDASTGSFKIANNMRPRVIHLDFPPLPARKSGERSVKLTENDAFLSSVLDLLPSPKYTVLYITTPSTSNPATSPLHPSHHGREPESSYQMDTLFQSPVHMELKRDLSSGKKGDSGEKPILPDGPLFERYSFLSPGLFMGFLVSLILLSILYVGISGIAGLQVTYAAFDKEMGPAAQKKAQ